MAKTKTVRVCPNCGFILRGPEFLSSVENAARQIGSEYAGFDPVAGRFTCPKCNYAGLPIEMNEQEHRRARFENKPQRLPISKATQKSTQYAMIWLFGTLLLILLLAMLGVGYEITGTIGIISILGLLASMAIESKNKG